MNNVAVLESHTKKERLQTPEQSSQSHDSLQMS